VVLAPKLFKALSQLFHIVEAAVMGYSRIAPASRLLLTLPSFEAIRHARSPKPHKSLGRTFYILMLMDRYLAVMLGAGLGGLARFVAGTAIMQRYGGAFPLGTVVINITGSFLIGLMMTLLTERWQVHPNWRLFLVTGVLGGYTTFSSFEYETLQAMRRGGAGMALLNVVGSVALGYAAVWLGAWVVGRNA
jgi:CrcB protein